MAAGEASGSLIRCHEVTEERFSGAKAPAYFAAVLAPHAHVEDAIYLVG